MTDDQHHTSAGTDKQHQQDEEMNDEMQEPGEMMLRHPLKEPWIQYGVISLGLWLIFSPFSLGYESVLMTWSDVLTGIVIVGLGGLTIA